MDDNPDFEEMTKIVKDAGMFEENMSRGDIESICKIVTQSKREVESRRLSESQEELVGVRDGDTSPDISRSPSLLERNQIFTPKTWSITKSKLPNESKMAEEDDSDDLPNSSSVDSLKDATDCCFGFNDMHESTENRLRFIPREIQFIPIQNSQIFSKANKSEKAKILYSYHTRMNTLRAQLARRSFHPAPLKNPVSIDEFFPSVLDNSDSVDTYISRSGRQTKRKVYYDQDEDSVDGTANTKKTKNSDEQEWPVKTKTLTRKTEVTIESRDMEDFEKTTVTNEEDKSTTKSILKSTENAKPTTRTKRLTNAEILKRSSLFSDSPPRLTRNDIIFDNLVEENNKKKKEDEVMETFQKSLKTYGEDERTALDVISIEDEEPVGQRVAPPPPVITGRKCINSRKKGLAPLDIKTAATSKNTPSKKNLSPSMSQDSIESSGPLPNRKKPGPSKRIPDDFQIQSDSAIAHSSRTSSSSSNIVPCPICGVNFPERKIMEHASSCGDEPMLTRSSQKHSRIVCQICDKVLPMSTQYEVHVRECLNKKKEDDMKNQ